jgi:peptidoglycan/LPS O-acetylase OafA/YrhL
MATWSLAIQMQFYFFTPLIIYVYQKSTTKGHLFSAFMISLNVLIRYTTPPYPEYNRFLYNRHGPYFIGALFYYLNKNHSFDKSQAKYMQMLPLALIPLHFYYLEPVQPGERGVYYNSATEATVLAFIICFFILGCLLQTNDFVNKLSHSRFVQFWAKISFAHFMTHFLFFETMQNRFSPWIEGWPLTFGGYVITALIIIFCPIPLSYLCLKYVEEPFWKLEAKFLQKYLP